MTCAGAGTRRCATSSRASTRVLASRGRSVAMLSATRWRSSTPSPPTRRSSRASPRPSRVSSATSPRTAGTSSGRASRVTRARRRPSPTSAPSSGSRPRSRSTPVASASSPATTSRRPPTSASRSSVSACSTRPATSVRASTTTAADRDLPGARPRWPAALAPARGGRHPAWSSSTSPVAESCAPRCGAPVGRVPLLLLDSDIPGKDDGARAVTERLYGGGGEHDFSRRSPGVAASGHCVTGRAHRRPTPDFYHSTRSRRLPAVERISEIVTDEGLSFDEALEAVRAATVFTTHTPVPAGIDRFERRLIEIYFGGALAPAGVPIDSLLELGKETYEGGDASMFNMAVLGLRIAQRANGVSVLHGHVSRHVRRAVAGLDADEVRSRASPTASTVRPGGPQGLEMARRHSDITDLDSRESWGPCRDPAGRGVGDQARARQQLVTEPGPGARVVDRTRRLARRARLDGKILDPDVLTIGSPVASRPTSAHADAERPPASRSCCSTPSARSRSSSPASPTPPTRPASSSSSRW